MRVAARQLLPGAIFLLAGVMFLPGINWGLPSRRIDPILFGTHKPWTGQKLLDLAGNWDESADRGADIAMHPLTDRQQPIAINQTEVQRAQIIRRFRLYSCQPDEMITFRSLSSMKPGIGDFDPRFYQYGGLWVYPIGALLKLAGMFRLITLNSNLAFYLDHPEEFARFYIIARLYAAAWGLIGVAVVYAIGKEWTGQKSVGLNAALFYVLMPVVVNMAHEAKPHLPGAVLILAAILAAMRFVKTGLTRYWIFAGVLCGAAFGMVLTGIVSFAVLPVMTLLRPTGWKNRINITAAAAGIGLIVFAATNPYLPRNIFFHHAVVKSNVGNYGNFYRPQFSIDGIENALKLVVEGTSLALGVVALPALLFLIRRSRWSSLGWLLAAPGILIALQFGLLAHDQAAEYARFAVALDILLVLACACALGALPRTRIFITSIIVILTGPSGLRYTINFVTDTTRFSSRVIASRVLSGYKNTEDILAVSAEPAPYCLPPVDLFAWKIVLLPAGASFGGFHPGAPFVYIRPSDTGGDDANSSSGMITPISWANKPFQIIQR